MISFQKLDVYKVACEFAALALDGSRKAPRGSASLMDQLRRAATSVPLNIAEGAGRATPKDAAHSYAIARGSAMECAAIFDMLKLAGIVTDEEHRHATGLLKRVVAMLTKMGVR